MITSKKKFVLSLLVIALVMSVVMSCGAAFARREASVLRITNRSGRTIETVFLKESDYDDYIYGEDNLNTEPLKNGEFVELSFLDSRKHAKAHDLLVLYPDGTYDEWLNKDIFDLSEIVIEKNGATSYVY